MGRGVGLLVRNVAAKAGVACRRGGGGQPEGADRDGVERPVPGGLLWMISGVDYPAPRHYQTQTGDLKLEKLIAKAKAAGDLPDMVYRPRMGGTEVYGEYYIGHPTVDMSSMLSDDSFLLWQNVPYEWALHMDDSTEDNTRAIRELRGFIYAEAAFLNKYVPGFENSFIVHVGRQLGIRDGRHPEGEYCFTLADPCRDRLAGAPPAFHT